MIPEQAVTLSAGDGVALEARLALAPAAPGGIVICHPHPLYGGDMDNPVVVRVAEVCGALGWATLRFNFRGVGRSTGTHDGGRAEAGDVEAALDRLEAAGVRPLVLAGYSFGAMVAATVAADRPGLAGLLLIAPPVALRGRESFAALQKLGAPLLVVAGDADEHCPPEALEWLRTTLPQAGVSVIEGATHFFFGKLYPLGETVGEWARGLGTRQARGRGGAG